MELTTGPRTHSTLKSLVLILTSLILLPLSTFLLTLTPLLTLLTSPLRLRHQLRGSPAFRAKTILIAGVSTPAGLRLARAFYETGCDVIGADFEPEGIYIPARFSKALRSFVRLRPWNSHYGAALYMKDVVEAAKRGSVELFVNCSPGIPAEENSILARMLEEKTGCVGVSLQEDMVKHFTTHEGSLLFVKSLGLPVPEFHKVKSRDDVHRILHESQGRKRYTLNNVANGNGNGNGNAVPVTKNLNPKTMLPRRTLSQTYNDLSSIRITNESPWILEQHFVLGEEYNTFALVVAGQLTAFAAAHVSKYSTAYKNIRADGGIGAAMRKFVETFIQRVSEKRGEDFTTNLSMTFRVEERETGSGIEWSILPIDIKISVSPPLLLFSGTVGAMALNRAYMSVLMPSANGLSTFTGGGALPDSMDHVIAPKSAAGVYFIGQDLVNLVLRPAVQLLKLKINVLQLVWSYLTFVEHLGFWREGGWEVWDPLPGFLLYHVYLPATLWIGVWKGERIQTSMGLLE